MELVDKIIRRMHITWADTDEWHNVEEQVRSGIAFLNGIAGSVIDFDTDEIAYQLLYDYVRYLRSDCSELFEKNYLSSLNALRLRYRIKRSTETEVEEDETEITD